MNPPSLSLRLAASETATTIAAVTRYLVTSHDMLLADAERREYRAEERVVRDLARDLAERLVRLPELLGHELEGGALRESRLGELEQALRARERVDVAAPRRPGAAVGLVARRGLQLLAQFRQAAARQRRDRDGRAIRRGRQRLRRRQVRLVPHDERRRARRQLRDLARAVAARRVDDVQDEIGPAHLQARATQALDLDDVVAVAQARGIHDVDGQPV